MLYRSLHSVRFPFIEHQKKYLFDDRCSLLLLLMLLFKTFVLFRFGTLVIVRLWQFFSLLNSYILCASKIIIHPTLHERFDETYVRRLNAHKHTHIHTSQPTTTVRLIFMNKKQNKKHEEEE